MILKHIRRAAASVAILVSLSACQSADTVSQPPTARAECERSPDLGYYASSAWKQRADARVARMRETGAKVTVIDGRGGRDRLVWRSGGDLFLTAVVHRNMEIYDVANNADNRIIVMAPALAAALGRHVEVYGDPGRDVVGLDPCLDWQGPRLVTPGDGKPARWRYRAKDQDGLTARVDIGADLGIVVQPNGVMGVHRKLMRDE